jgi:hypothetical protein
VKARGLGFFVLGGFVAFVLAVYLYLSSASRGERQPVVAGQQVPQTVHTIDFAKRYDLVIRGYGGEGFVYRNCRIVGFTGGRQEASGSDSYQGWNRWIVLELADGRLAYIPPSNVFSIEQTAQQPQAR